MIRVWFKHFHLSRVIFQGHHVSISPLVQRYTSKNILANAKIKHLLGLLIASRNTEPNLGSSIGFKEG